MLTLPDFYLVLFFLLAVGQVSLAYFLWKREKNFLDKISGSFGLPQQEKENWKLWHTAQKKAQVVMGEAELEGIKVVADSKFAAKKLEDVYEDQMRVVGVKMEKELERITAVAQQEFGRFLATRSAQTDKLVDDEMEAFTKRLEEKLVAIEDRILKFAQEEEMRVRLEAENYRKQMMDLTAEDAVAVLDKVEKVILGKKITPEIQTELISKVLEQAKKDAFIS